MRRLRLLWPVSCLSLACGGPGGANTSFGSSDTSPPAQTSEGSSGEASSSGGEVVTTDASGGSSGTTSEIGASSSGSTGAPGTPCSKDQDCSDSPDGPHCDVEAGLCTGGACEPGAEQPCYTGPAGTDGVGACVAGVATCAGDGSGFGACEGQVEPTAEVCGNATDDDCDGEVDEDDDADGDGWGVCGGDCCDVAGGDCFDPELVNPGAYEYAGNAVDDDCDGQADEAPTACDVGLASDLADPIAYAKAMDLCQFTTEAPADPKDRTWGVISAKFSLADGTGSPAPASRSIRPGFGDVIKPQKHSRLVALSSGHAADANDAAPPHAAFESGKNMNKSSPPPQDWWAAIGGKFPNPPGCEVPMLPSANDPVMLTLRVRAPTNAKSFSAKVYFFSAEYPEYVCSQYNDFFVALIDSQSDANPADKNIAVYDDGQTKWPIGVNLVKVAEGLFTQCEGGEVGCASKEPPSDYLGCEGTGELKGTGFDAFDDFACEDAPQQQQAGGGTGWLTLRGNVEPGETMEIRFAIWDTGGHIYDSLVLLDAWEWSIDPAAPGVTPG